jgi:hypothetical protein
VALTVMSVELAKDRNQRKRFRNEARAVSGLTHRHICTNSSRFAFTDPQN